jgi:hypothetical protein
LIDVRCSNVLGHCREIALVDPALEDAPNDSVGIDRFHWISLDSPNLPGGLDPALN